MLKAHVLQDTLRYQYALIHCAQYYSVALCRYHHSKPRQAFEASHGRSLIRIYSTLSEFTLLGQWNVHMRCRGIHQPNAAPMDVLAFRHRHMEENGRRKMLTNSSKVESAPSPARRPWFEFNAHRDV